MKVFSRCCYTSLWCVVCIVGWLSVVSLFHMGVTAYAESASDQDHDVEKEEAETKHYTLEELQLIASSNSPQIGASDSEVAYAEARLGQAKYYWTPKLQWDINFIPMPKADVQDGEGDVYKEGDGWGIFFQTELEAYMPIFSSMKIYNTCILAEMGVDAEKLKRENERIKVSYDVARAFYALQLADAGLHVIADAQHYIERIQTQYEKLMKSGSPSVKKSDRYRIELEGAKLEKMRNEAISGRKLARTALGVHTKLEGRIDVVEMSYRVSKREQLMPYDALLAEARKARIDLQLLQIKQQAARQEAYIKWLGWWPDFALAASIDYAYSNAVPGNGDDTIFSSDRFNHFRYGVLLKMRWKLDPVRQIFEVRQADAKAQKAVYERELAIQGIELQIEEQYNKTANERKNVDISYLARRSAKRFLSQELMDYEAGDGNVRNLVDALTDYLTQRSNYLYALHNYWVAVEKLRKVSGLSRVTIVIAESDEQE